jgi:hypothetical protein
MDLNKILQEKFIAVSEPIPRGPSGWVSDKSARDVNMVQPRHPTLGQYQNQRSQRFNEMPPGMNIEDQRHADITAERDAGELGTGTQATSDVTVESLHKGYSLKKMRPTDDQETQEHEAPFYWDAEADGVVGYCERGNVCDRQ